MPNIIYFRISQKYIGTTCLHICNSVLKFIVFIVLYPFIDQIMRIFFYLPTYHVDIVDYLLFIIDNLTNFDIIIYMIILLGDGLTGFYVIFYLTILLGKILNIAIFPCMDLIRNIRDDSCWRNSLFLF